MNSLFGNELFCFVAVRITNYTTVPTAYWTHDLKKRKRAFKFSCLLKGRV